MIRTVIKSLFNSRLHRISFPARPCGLEIIDTTVHLFRLCSSANNIKSNTTQFTLDWRAEDCKSKLLSSSPQCDIIAFSFTPLPSLVWQSFGTKSKIRNRLCRDSLRNAASFRFWFYGCASKCVTVWCIIHEGAERIAV